MQRRNLIITRATELLADKMLQIASYHNLCGQMYQPESPVQRAWELREAAAGVWLPIWHQQEQQPVRWEK